MQMSKSVWLEPKDRILEVFFAARIVEVGNPFQIDSILACVADIKISQSLVA